MKIYHGGYENFRRQSRMYMKLAANHWWNIYLLIKQFINLFVSFFLNLDTDNWVYFYRFRAQFLDRKSFNRLC